MEQAVRAALRGEVGELPAAPAAAIKLLRLTRDDDTGVAAISRVIETEPAIAAKVLRIVNSAFYGFPRRVHSIRRAVTLLGFSTIRQTALHLLFYDGLVRRRGGTGHFDPLHFWQHSLLVAILSRGMAERLGLPDPDALYAAGLLHDLGKAILESRGRVCYSDFLAATGNSGNPVREDERTFFGVSHDRVGAAICKLWELPETVCRVQSLHHSPLSTTGLEPGQVLEVAIVALADFIAWTQGIGSVEGNRSPRLVPEVTALVDPARLDLADLLERADREIQEIGSFYGLKFPAALQLRANMVSTAIGLAQTGADAPAATASAPRSSHTAPHQSLDQDVFIPHTLEALQEEFGTGHLLMMQIESRRRALVATHARPASATDGRPPLELMIPSLSGDLVRCLRERRPVVIGHSPDNTPILQRLGVDQAAAVPVMSHGRLLGLLWLYNDPADGPLDIGPLPEVLCVAGELGIALERSRAFAMERAKAEMDALTRLHNRAAADRFLAGAVRQGLETGSRFAVGLVDIDHFKRFNDRFGHQTGDDVLRIVADTMHSLTRPSDFLGRYGGEEFVFVLMDTDGKGALGYAERIRREIERRGRLLAERFPDHALTISIGVTLSNPSGAKAEELLAAADRALYRAKEAGRNRVMPAW